MTTSGVPNSFSRVEIARIQLERALELFLSGSDFVSAITLAGAAEEITGKLLGAAGKRHAIDDLADAALCKRDSRSDPERKAIVGLANRIRNGLKHSDDGRNLTFDPQAVAAEMLDRAVQNHFTLTHEESPQMATFKERWLMRR